MGTAKKANEVLSQAERQLQGLVGDAASVGDYEGATRITELARTLHNLAGGFQKESGCLKRCTAQADGRPAPRASTRNGSPRRQSGRSTKAARKRDYPRFSRRDGVLVKTGWSKSDRSEYEHKAPRRVVDLLASALSNKAAQASFVTTDDFLPLTDPDDGSEVPSYQAYLCLAWLRVEGLVKQEGRRGYAVPYAPKLFEAVERHWVKLGTS